MQRILEFFVPGDLTSATGGYEYDRRIVRGLRELGWTVRVHELHVSFPHPSSLALEHAAQGLAALRDGALVLIDGLALGAMPQLIQAQRDRLLLLGLVHHPLAAETGLDEEQFERLANSERAALAAVRGVIVTSVATRDALRAYHVPATSISVIEPGTDPVSPACARYPRDPSAPLAMLCVASIIPRKGHGLLVDALAPLKHFNWTLTCVGSMRRSPGTVQQLRSRVLHAGLAERVLFAGELTGAELAGAYQQADLFVLATYYEGYGMAVAEALAHGLPIVSTLAGAIARIVPADAGLLVAPGDVRALRDALERVVGEPGLLAAFGAGAQRASIALPSWADSCARLAQHLLQTLTQDPPQGAVPP